jgi:hypothetical protein
MWYGPRKTAANLTQQTELVPILRGSKHPLCGFLILSDMFSGDGAHAITTII